MKENDKTISVLLTVVAISFLISFWNLLTVQDLQIENRKLEDTVYNTLNKLEDYKWYTNDRIGRLQNTSQIHWNNITSNYREMTFIERRVWIEKETERFVFSTIIPALDEEVRIDQKEYWQWLQSLKEEYNQ